MPEATLHKIPLQLAVKKAIEHCTELFSPSGSNFMLEEVEYSESEGVWLITIGFDVEKTVRTPLDRVVGFGGPQTVRQYKQVKIHSNTGAPLSVHIRKLD